MSIERSNVVLTKEDFASDQMVKWCPGCGSHAILAALENVFPKIKEALYGVFWKKKRTIITRKYIRE